MSTIWEEGIVRRRAELCSPLLVTMYGFRNIVLGVRTGCSCWRYDQEQPLPPLCEQPRSSLPYISRLHNYIQLNYRGQGWRSQRRDGGIAGCAYWSYIGVRTVPEATLDHRLRKLGGPGSGGASGAGQLTEAWPPVPAQLCTCCGKLGVA